jgi:hypothetical protein
MGDGRPSGENRLRLMLRIGAAIWLVLLLVGFFAPGGWTWGMAGPIGHMQNYVISLWLVSLVLAPLIASRAPLQQTGAIQVYFLGLVAITLSTFRGTPLEFKLIADVPPLVAVAVSIGLVFWSHPERSRLLRL